ncbi:hypothetical protein Noc_0959 [Nitrosococcus oceani ATCC 19707]|uniref:Uncharacterized protein n=2 Tax=Nitrosococcus oceani TaxID=1229 RepID=Q3JCH6_NITOC|nr:hypothetical protein [Nitrosococcus oceani]ABA57470.1 hypothetical protein Noc_0959 [Nitrosococcus oceani ATCC 19707]EDZ67958.1 hypothetical protein NOC27_1285 [Nitrosococcus oceani AFC27]KFI20101.1 hypothetical protein IB75_04905 [Nitrosococcus oceani C-27]GEM21718.1 hypothetical protein NONS58_31680 [Nitrosococcus oceani]
MPEFSFIPGSLLLSSTLAYVGLMPDIIDCDAKKAVPNSVMEVPVGVSGRCDPKKAAGEMKKGVVRTVQDSREETRDSVENKVGDSCGEGKRRLNQDGD